jgi:hypothetical protein
MKQVAYAVGGGGAQAKKSNVSPLELDLPTVHNFD